jgi:hypothetical protein
MYHLYHWEDSRRLRDFRAKKTMERKQRVTDAYLQHRDPTLDEESIKPEWLYEQVAWEWMTACRYEFFLNGGRR